MSETFICSRCSEKFPLENCTLFDGEALCPDCMEEHACVCSHCGDRIWQDNSVCDEHLILCQHCADTYYDHCADCGRLVDLDDLYYLEEGSCIGYCETCYNERAHGNGVRSYCYKPIPIFYGHGPRYFGVELEIDNGGESDQNANLIEGTANTDYDHTYIKHDGSLHDGLEIVTHPCPLTTIVMRCPGRRSFKRSWT